MSDCLEKKRWKIEKKGEKGKGFEGFVLWNSLTRLAQFVRFKAGSQDVQSVLSWYPVHSTRYWIFLPHCLESRILLTSHSRWSWTSTGSGGGWAVPGKGEVAGWRRETWNMGWIFHTNGSLSLNAFLETISMISKGPSCFSENLLVGRVVLIFEALSYTLLPTCRAGALSWCLSSFLL